MVRPSLISRIKRWLGASKPRKLVLVGGFAMATLAVTSFAVAQEPAPGAAPTAAPAPAGPAAHEGAPGAPAAEGKHEGEGHEAAEGHESGHHGIEPFNFADFDRYKKEKEEVDAKKRDAAVTPYIYVLINALVLFALYYYLGRKPIMAGLKARRDAVAKELDEAAQIKAEAKAKLEEYSNKLKKLGDELERMKAELTLAGEKDRDRIVKEAEEKAERMRKDAQFLIEQEVKQLRIDMLKHAVLASSAAAEQVLKSKLSSADHDRLANEYLGQLAALPEPGAKGAMKGGAS